jgi:hypothetical protein
MFLLFGCLLAFLIAAAPRLVLIFAAIFGTRWDLVWRGNWVLPILGIIFLPYTTVMYMLVWNPVGGIVGFDWVWLGLGFLLDLMKWASIYQSRQGIPGYSSTETPVVETGTGAPMSAPPPEAPSSEPTE